MHIVWCILIVILPFTGSSLAAHAPPDTSVSITRKLNAGVSAAWQNAVNWLGNDIGSLMLACDIDYNGNRTGNRSGRICNVRLELGYTYFNDSIWFKHADKLTVQYLFKASNQRFSQTASVSGSTHFLNSYLYDTDPVTGSGRQVLSEPAFNPSALEAGYGTGYTFLRQSFVNVSLATARLRVVPVRNHTGAETGIRVSGVRNGVVVFDYGFSVQYFVLEELLPSLEVNSTGRMFIKAFHRDELEAEVTGKISFRIRKYFRLHADVKVTYAPEVSYRLQFRNELRFGLYVERVAIKSKN